MEGAPDLGKRQHSTQSSAGTNRRRSARPRNRRRLCRRLPILDRVEHPSESGYSVVERNRRRPRRLGRREVADGRWRIAYIFVRALRAISVLPCHTIGRNYYLPCAATLLQTEINTCCALTTKPRTSPPKRPR